jgi:hypothetical protein
MTNNLKKQKPEHAQSGTKIKNDTPSGLKRPDFAARRKRIFGDRVLTVVDDLIKDRGRY